MNHSLIAKMGKNAYQTMQGKFTPDENARKIMMVYENVEKKIT